AGGQLVDRVAGRAYRVQDRLDVLAARRLQGEHHLGLSDRPGGEGAIVADVEDVGALVGDDGGEASQGARPIGEDDGQPRQPTVLDQATLDHPGHDVDIDVPAREDEGHALAG